MNDNDIENEVMDARKWIELGKMFNNMNLAGYDVKLKSEVRGDGRTIHTCDVFAFGWARYASEKFMTPYSAIKDVYFRFFLKKDISGIQTELKSVGTVSLEKLYKESDKLGVPVEQVILFNKERVTESRFQIVCPRCWHTDYHWVNTKDDYWRYTCSKCLCKFGRINR